MTWIGAGLLIAGAWTAAETIVAMERGKSRESAALLTRNLSSLFAENIGRVVSVIDRSLISLRDRVEVWSPDGLGIDPRTPLELTELDPVADLVMHSAATDRFGRIVTSTFPAAIGIDVSDRVYFKAARDGDRASLVVSEPVLSRASGEMSVAFVRSLRDGRGDFAGLVQIVLSSSSLARFYQSIDLGAAASVALLRSDGVRLAIAPASAHDTAVVRKPWAQDAVAGLAPGDARILREYDDNGQPRTTAYRPVTGLPFIVRVSISDPAAIGQDRFGLEGPRAAAIGVTALALIGLLVLLTYQRRLNCADADEARRSAELEKRQQHLDAALDNMNQGLLMVDGAGDVVLVNRKLIELLDLPDALHAPPYAFADLLGWQRGVGEFDVGSCELSPDLFRFIESGGVARDSRDPFLSYERVRPNGRAFEVRSTPLAGGGFVRTFTDVTERHRYERELAERERRSRELAKIVETTPNQVIVTGADRRITWVNEPARRFIGRELGDILGRTVPELLFGRESVPEAEAAEAIDRVRRGESVVLDHARYGAGGAEIWISETISPIIEADGTVTAIVSVATDITERYALENDLRESQRFLTDVAEIAGVGGWEYDIPTRTLIWLDGTRRMFELDDAFVVTPQSVDRLCPPEAREAIAAVRREAIRNGTPFDIEVALLTARGRPVWMRFRGRLERDATRHRLIGTFQDVTTRKDREQTIERYAEDLERFAHVASHDLQEPLRKIATHTRLLGEAMSEGDGPEIERCRAVLEESAGRGRTIVSDLLRYAKLKDKPVARAAVPLRDLIAPVVARAREASPDARFELSLPDTALSCDIGLVTQVFENLIGNAVKYRKPGAPAEVVVAAEADPRRGGLRIAVRDGGIGFDMSHAETVFQPFKRLVRRDDYQGTGIGLSLVRSIVEKHGWTVSVESAPGVGSTFTVAVPASDVVSRDASIAA